MDTCGICQKPVVQLFETGKEGVFACFKCQPLVPEVTLDTDNDNADQPDQLLQERDPQRSELQGGSEFYCAICNKSFQKNMQLQNHLRNHRAERRFVCTYCDKAFSQSNNLRAHLRIHTNERPYKCSVCDKAFTQVTNLNNHMRLHTGERPFACPEPGCNKAYAQVTNLNQHRKRHLNGREVESCYVCTVCGEQFDQRNHMYEHRRSVHGHELKSPTQPRPAAATLACKLCSKDFTTLKRLMAHVAGHMGVTDAHGEQDAKPSLKCVFASCGALFTSAGEHTEHLLRAHQLKLSAGAAAEAAGGRAAQPARRGRPPKILSQKTDPLALDPKEYSYEVQVIQLKQYAPKLKVENIFQ